MKIAILSSASAGGAGIAAYRIYESFKATTDHEVDFFDMTVLGQVDPEVSPTDSATNRKVTNTHFTMDYASDVRDWAVDLLCEYDVINIQWSSYLISLAEILELAKRGNKILFTLHDFHYFTGGCHYPAGCLGYLKNCVGCPQVNEKLFSQPSVIATNKLKRAIFSYPNVHLSAPSAFIVKSALSSGIVPQERAHVLRNAYHPIADYIPKLITQNKSILLIADSFNEQRKGLVLAVDSLKLASTTFRQENKQVTLHLVGGLDAEVVKRLDGSDIKIIVHGHVKEHHKLVDIFKQCEFILSCSYEDNWPNILVEAGSYGCVPIVGKWHGCEEFVSVLGLGYAADNYSSHAFYKAINEAVFSQISPKTVASYVFNVRNIHAPDQVVSEYLNVISEGTNVHEKLNILNPRNDIDVSANHLVSASILKDVSKTAIEIKVIETPFGLQKLLNSKLQVRTKEELIKHVLLENCSAHKNSECYGIKQLNLSFLSI